jgi:hypothetical protein
VEGAGGTLNQPIFWRWFRNRIRIPGPHQFVDEFDADYADRRPPKSAKGAISCSSTPTSSNDLPPYF